MKRIQSIQWETDRFHPMGRTECLRQKLPVVHAVAQKTIVTYIWKPLDQMNDIFNHVETWQLSRERESTWTGCSSLGAPISYRNFILFDWSCWFCAWTTKHRFRQICSMTRLLIDFNDAPQWGNILTTKLMMCRWFSMKSICFKYCRIDERKRLWLTIGWLSM